MIYQLLLSPRLGGAETLAASLETEWREQGVESTTVYLDPGERQGRVRRAIRLRRVLSRLGRDVVVAHSAIPGVYARLLAPRRVPVVVVVHSLSSEFRHSFLGLIERLTARRAAAYVAVSHAAKRSYFHEVRPRGRVKIHVIPNGVAANSSAPLAIPGRVVISTVARLVDVKRPDLWLRAAQGVLAEGADVVFRWWGPAGDSAAQDAIRIASEHDDRIAWCGPTADPSEVYASSHILFHPAERESQGLAILEAAVSGLPVVCQDKLEAVDDRVVRLTFSNEEGAVAQILEAIRIWPSLRARAEATRSEIAEYYSVSQCAKSYLELLDERNPGVI